MDIRFVSGNAHKIKEVTTILESAGINVIPFSRKIEEIQTEDEFKLVKDKVLKAFNEIGRPLFVEHTGLYIHTLNGLPGGLTEIFWNKLQADKFSEIFGNIQDTTVKAKTIICYCDGVKINNFQGEIMGTISPIPRGDRTFQWDCVFIPEGYDKTFAELGDKKNDISMRKVALLEFSNFLKGI